MLVRGSKAKQDKMRSSTSPGECESQWFNSKDPPADSIRPFGAKPKNKIVRV